MPRSRPRRGNAWGTRRKHGRAGLTGKADHRHDGRSLDLAAGHVLARLLGGRGYRLIETGMKNRLFLRRRSDLDGQVFHLHIVEQTTWADRKERLMRDYLIHHPAATKVYGDLKVRLAAQYAEDSLAYTKAKTAFIQHIVDEARAEHGLSRIDVWNE
jgi:GrpB-like predicted nucleotidyltransferase (UPF0157 family)